MVDPDKYGGDEEFVYVGARRIAEDMSKLADPIIADDLRCYLLGRFGESNGEIVDPSEIRDIWKRFEIYANALKDRRYRRVPEIVRSQVMDRDGRRCVRCGSEEELAIDHKHPFSRGGKHKPSNLQVLCRACNSRKGARTMEEWEAMQ